MCVLDESSKRLTLEGVDLSGKSLEQIHGAIKRTNGIIKAMRGATIIEEVLRVAKK